MKSYISPNHEIPESPPDDIAAQKRALERTGGDPSQLIFLRALRRTWTEKSLASAQKLAHIKGVEDGTITELFTPHDQRPTDVNHISNATHEHEMRHVKILPSELVVVDEVTPYDQDRDIS